LRFSPQTCEIFMAIRRYNTTELILNPIARLDFGGRRHFDFYPQDLLRRSTRARAFD
jgi:hypothetical protein